MGNSRREWILQLFPYGFSIISVFFCGLLRVYLIGLKNCGLINDFKQYRYREIIQKYTQKKNRNIIGNSEKKTINNIYDKCFKDWIHLSVIYQLNGELKLRLLYTLLEEWNCMNFFRCGCAMIRNHWIIRTVWLNYQISVNESNQNRDLIALFRLYCVVGSASWAYTKMTIVKFGTLILCKSWKYCSIHTEQNTPWTMFMLKTFSINVSLFLLLYHLVFRQISDEC